MISTWIGPKRIAFIPVWNREVDVEPSNDWVEQVRARVFYDPDPSTGVDRSLQRYIQTLSSGLATIEGNVFPVVAADGADTMGAGLNSLPVNHGYDYAVAVLPHSVGPHRGGFAWMGTPGTNGVTNFSRVAMFSDVGMTNGKTLGVWAMEVLHMVTRFGDLYYANPAVGKFDVMSGASGTHPTAHTKSQLGWLRANAIRTNPLGYSLTHRLHAVSLPQPPPPWRASAIQVPSRNSTGHFLIEARLQNDQYESSSVISSGIPSEGVIVYEVQGPTEVYLRTPTALQAGEVFTDDAEKLTVRVLANEPGGFKISVNAGKTSRCKILAAQIETLELSLQTETDFNRRKQTISALQRAKGEFRRMGCLVLHNPPTEVFESRVFGAPTSGGYDLENRREEDGVD